MESNPSAAPVQAPTEIKPETGWRFAEQVATVAGDIGGVVGGIPGGVPEAPPPPPPPPAPVRVGGAIQPPKKVRDQAPTYPPIAQSARVQGVVILEATIGPDGRVQDVRVLRSIPLLDAAAIEAVQAMAVHADVVERRAGAGHHDGHGQFHSAVIRGPVSLEATCSRR